MGAEEEVDRECHGQMQSRTPARPPMPTAWRMRETGASGDPRQPTFFEEIAHDDDEYGFMPG